jgi:hypothetical protein
MYSGAQTVRCLPPIPGLHCGGGITIAHPGKGSAVPLAESHLLSLLSLLPQPDRSRLHAISETVRLKLGTVLCQPGEPTRHARFPNDCFLSLVTAVPRDPATKGLTMIYKFKSRSAGDLIMLCQSGDQMLGLIGKAPATKGIIEPAAMSAAIMALEEAIEEDETQRRRAHAQAVAEGRVPPPAVRVTLRQRAWPLVEMLKRAKAEESDIVWGV